MLDRFINRPVICLAIAVASAWGGVARAAEANPEFAGWDKCKPGATTTIHVTVEALDTTESNVVSKLVELQPDKAVLEVTMSVTTNGRTLKGQPVKRIIPKELIGSSTTQSASSVPNKNKLWDSTQGTETLTVMGKSIACQTLDIKMRRNDLGIESETKTWNCPDIPGFVRMESSTNGPLPVKTHIELVEFKDGK